MNGSMYLGFASLFLWHGRQHDLQRLHLAFGGHLYFTGGHGGHVFLPPQFILSMGIGPGKGSGGLGGCLGPDGSVSALSQATLQENCGHDIRERGHGFRVPMYLGCLHFLQHDTAAIKTNNWSTRSSIFVILKGLNIKVF